VIEEVNLRNSLKKEGDLMLESLCLVFSDRLFIISGILCLTLFIATYVQH